METPVETEAAMPYNSRAIAMMSAVVLTSFLIALPLGSIGFLLLLPILIITALAALILGVPAYLAARSLGIDNGWTAALAGAFTGVTAAMVLVLPGPAWNMEHSIAALAIGGAAAGVYFYLQVVWPAASRRTRRRWSGAVVGLVALAYGVHLSGFDWSCHNPLRYISGIRPSTYFSINPRKASWPEVATEAERFAAANGWSVRRSTSDGSAARSDMVSICKEPGTVFQIMGGTHGIEVIAYQPQDNDSWIAPMRTLHARLIQRWPGALRYYDDLGADTDQPPAWAASAPSPKPSSAAR